MRLQARRNQTDTYINRLLCMILLITSAEISAEPNGAVKRSQEVEFDSRIVKGQKAEGAVYLFQRARRTLPPLLQFKRDYLTPIVSPYFQRSSPLGQMLLENKHRHGIEDAAKGVISSQKVEPLKSKDTKNTSIKRKKKMKSKKAKRRKKRNRVRGGKSR